MFSDSDLSPAKRKEAHSRAIALLTTWLAFPNWKLEQRIFSQASAPRIRYQTILPFYRTLINRGIYTPAIDVLRDPILARMTSYQKRWGHSWQRTILQRNLSKQALSRNNNDLGLLNSMFLHFIYDSIIYFLDLWVWTPLSRLRIVDEHGEDILIGHLLVFLVPIMPVDRRIMVDAMLIDSCVPLLTGRCTG